MSYGDTDMFPHNTVFCFVAFLVSDEIAVRGLSEAITSIMSSILSSGSPGSTQTG